MHMQYNSTEDKLYILKFHVRRELRRSSLNGQCYNVPLQTLFETLHIERKGDLCKDTIANNISER